MAGGTATYRSAGAEQADYTARENSDGSGRIMDGFAEACPVSDLTRQASGPIDDLAMPAGLAGTSRTGRSG